MEGPDREFFAYRDMADVLANREKIFLCHLLDARESERPTLAVIEPAASRARDAVTAVLEHHGFICTLKQRACTALGETWASVQQKMEDTDGAESLAYLGKYFCEMDSYLRDHSWPTNRERLGALLEERGIQATSAEVVRLLIYELNHRDRIGLPQVLVLPNTYPGHVDNPSVALIRCADGAVIGPDASDVLSTFFSGNDTAWMAALMRFARDWQQ